MAPEKELFVTRFVSQTLLGYKADDEGNILAKVFEGVAELSDKSMRTIYGMFYEGSLSISWDFSETQEKPSFNRVPLGVRREK